MQARSDPLGTQAGWAAGRQSPRSGRRASPVQGYPLAGTPFEYAAALACAAFVIAVFGLGFVFGVPVEVAPLVLLAVLVAAIALSWWLACAVLLLAVLLLCIEAATGSVPWGTAALEVGAFTVLSIFARVYAARFSSLMAGTGGHQSLARNLLGISRASAVFGLGNLVQLVDAADDGIVVLDERGSILYSNPAADGLLELTDDRDGGRRLVDRVVDDDRPIVERELDPVARRPAGRVSFRVRSKDGGVRDLDVHHALLTVHGRPTRTLAIRDITDVSRLHQAAAALAQTASSLAVTQPLDDTLAAIAQRVVEVTGACACSAFLIRGERDGVRSWRLAGQSGLPPGYEAAANRAARSGALLPIDESVRTGRPVFVEDLPQRFRDEPGLAAMTTVVDRVPWKLVVSLPLIYAGQPLGALAIYFPPGLRPDGPTMDFLGVTAGQAASSAEISRLVAAGQGQVAVEERHRLSRELHDSLSQAIYGIALGAKSARRRLATDPARAVEPLDYVLGLADTAIADMRSLVLQLRPESLEREGLMAALAQHARALNARQPPRLVAELGTEPAIPIDTKVAVFRIVQEALNNVVKHAHAEHALLQVDVTDRGLAIDVSDDGQGFDTEASLSTHFGLQTMRERVAALRGDMTITSVPKEGTAVHVLLPVGRESSEPEEPEAAAAMAT